MKLRQAALDDLDTLVDVQQHGAVQALAHIFPQDRYPFPRADLLRRWSNEIADPTTQTYVMTDARGHVLGFAATRGEELLHFGTAVESWGTGLAKQGHDAVVATLVEIGETRARLRVFEENYRARRFYEKLGWHHTGQRGLTSFPPYPVLLTYELDLTSYRE